MIQVFGDRVVVRPAERAEMTPGGIALPQQVQHKPIEGTVVAVGPGKTLEGGSVGPMPYAPGDRVIYSKYGGQEINVDGETLLVLHIEDIVGRITQ